MEKTTPAEVLAAHFFKEEWGGCNCGQWRPSGGDMSSWDDALHAEHQIAELEAAGFKIIHAPADAHALNR